MRKLIVLLAGLVLMSAMALPANAGPFTDVPTDHWAYAAIDKLQSEGFVEGYPDGTFRGNRSFTRYEMAMVVARIWDRIEYELENIQMPDMDNYVTDDELQDELALLYDLIDEFAAELDTLGMRVDDLEGRMDGLEGRVSYLESFLDNIQWGGALRSRIEGIVTNDYSAAGGFANPSGALQYGGIIAGTPGSNPGEAFEFEQLVDIFLRAQPSDTLDVYVLLEHRSSYLDSASEDLTLYIKEAWVTANMMAIMGWTPTEIIDTFNLVVGRQYYRQSEFGMIFDNGYMALPGIGIYLSGSHIDASAFLARNSRFGTQEGIGVANVSYGFGDSRSQLMNRDHFAVVGANYLGTGFGNEQAVGVDIDTELLDEAYLNRLRIEYIQMIKDQLGFDVDDSYGDDFANSIIAWVDLYNDGNLRVSGAFADIGLVPGFTSIDNNPFEEYDALFTGIGGNINYSYESGLNPFPSNFQGGGMQIEYTWWDVLHTMLTFYDGQNQAEEDLPAVIILHINYPLNDASDVRLTYIHSGIDALTLAKLRGEFLVRF
ncbi:MAG TPA: S-layer homology domain-containing protein [bacterium]|jgi:hypothetical protein